jgi:hypothetical protein
VRMKRGLYKFTALEEVDFHVEILKIHPQHSSQPSS